ncbi:MAG: phosphoglucosamine mutase [Clostridia bacterium]|nr:MAG: phosphoglucosamine mutase [Clostridia bacterium]
MGKLFGTDGVRGVANRQLTPELALQLGRAAAYLLKDNGTHPAVVVGRDTRLSGDMLEAALTAGLCSAGAEVWRLGVLPTPAVIWLTRHLGAAAGVVISASHNPATDNGIKFCSNDGYKLSDALEERIEALLADPDLSLPYPEGAGIGRLVERAEVRAEYVAHVLGTVNVDLSGLKVVVDCAQGAASQITPMVLEQLGAKVVALNTSPNGMNINQDCGSLYPGGLQQAVSECEADVGLAHDGDADRVIAVDEKGALVDGDKIMAICGLDLHRQGRLWNNAVVVTVMSNLGLHHVLRRAGIAVYTTPVGDRYVLEEMQRCGAVLGGEQSGHIIFLEHNTTGDGLITALQLLQVMVRTGRPLSELAGVLTCLPQVMYNIAAPDQAAVLNHPEFIQAVERNRCRLGGEGRVLVRPSGTEPVIRIMAEGPDVAELEAIVAELSRVASREHEQVVGSRKEVSAREEAGRIR